MMTERIIPDDAMLVRYIDGEATEDERARVEAAVAANEEVAARVAQLEMRSRAAHAAIAAGDVPVPARLQQPGVSKQPASRVWLRAALLIGTLGVASLAVPPVRAWIRDFIGTDESEGGAVPAPAPVAIDTVAIFFDAPPEFLIELAEPQRSGRLIVRIADVEQASAELRTPGGTESFFVIPDGIQIVNGDVSTAEYEVTLPRTVRDVRVRVPGQEDVTYATAGTERRVFELGGRNN